MEEQEPTILDKSYDSLRSDEKEDPHYNFDSDNEPPTDEPGDNLTIIANRKVTKTIISTGEGLGKPGRPFIVLVDIEGFFAKPEETVEAVAEKDEPKAKNGTRRAGINENRKRYKDDQA